MSHTTVIYAPRAFPFPFRVLSFNPQVTTSWSSDGSASYLPRRQLPIDMFGVATSALSRAASKRSVIPPRCVGFVSSMRCCSTRAKGVPAEVVAGGGFASSFPTAAPSATAQSMMMDTKNEKAKDFLRTVAELPRASVDTANWLSVAVIQEATLTGETQRRVVTVPNRHWHDNPSLPSCAEFCPVHHEVRLYFETSNGAGLSSYRRVAADVCAGRLPGDVENRMGSAGYAVWKLPMADFLALTSGRRALTR